MAVCVGCTDGAVDIEATDGEGADERTVAEAGWLADDAGLDVVGAETEHAATSNAPRPTVTIRCLIAQVICQASVPGC